MPKKIFGYAERPTSRLMSRLVAEFHLGCARDTIAALRDITGRPARLDHAIVMLVVLRLSEATQVTPVDIDTPPPRGGEISINAIATSLRRPFETVRRHVNLLLTSGVLMRGVHGVTISDETREHPALLRLRQQVHDGLVLLIEALATFAISLPASRTDAPYHPATTVAAAINLYLSGIEFLGPHYTSLLDMLVVNLVIAASVRHITHDLVMARRYAAADTLPPAEVRHFVNVAPLAASFGMSRSTIRRHLAKAIAGGTLEGSPQRARASDDYLDGPVVRAGGTAQAARAMQALTRLAAAGFDFTRPSDHYLAGRPERIPPAPARGAVAR